MFTVLTLPRRCSERCTGSPGLSRVTHPQVVSTLGDGWDALPNRIVARMSLPGWCLVRVAKLVLASGDKVNETIVQDW